jgi:hypothetical protein
MTPICIAPLKNCKNRAETYGEICVKCNKCHRFNPDWYCGYCGKRTRGMRSYKTWKMIEVFDVFRLPICPDCQPHFTKEELGIGRDYPKTLPFRKKQLISMLDWREDF